MFKIPMAPSRLNPLILSGTISHTADEVRIWIFQSQHLHILFPGLRILFSVCGEALLDGTIAGNLVETHSMKANRFTLKTFQDAKSTNAAAATSLGQ